MWSGLLGIGFFFIVLVPAVDADDGWVSKPGHGCLQFGFNRKYQLGAKRRDIDGKVYQALNHLTYDFRYAYVSGQVGLYPRVEANVLLYYLSASERFDAAAEEADAYYHGFSDVWLGFKYQVHQGAWPIAVGTVVRLPYLYTNKDKAPTGLLNRDLALKGYLSHDFGRMYFSAMAGFNWRESAPANQIIYAFEVAGRPGFGEVGSRMRLKFLIDGAASVGSDSPSTFPRDRFPGLTLETGGHFFNFNKATFIHPQVSFSYSITPVWNAQVGFGYVAWGKSAVVFTNLYAQLEYTF